MKVIIAGSRSFNSQTIMALAMETLNIRVSEVVSGTADGADFHGEMWAARRRVPVRRFPALWGVLDAPGAVVKVRRDGTPYNAKAGHQRNAAMADYVKGEGALVVFWDGESAGTRNMIKCAEERGIPIYGFLIRDGNVSRFL